MIFSTTSQLLSNLVEIFGLKVVIRQVYPSSLDGRIMKAWAIIGNEEIDRVTIRGGVVCTG